MTKFTPRYNPQKVNRPTRVMHSTNHPAHPIRPNQPYVNHETLMQDQQARFLGVEQETVLNLGHPCPVSEITEHPIKSGPTEYTGGPAERAVHESDRKGHGIYGSFADNQSGFSTEDNLKGWAGYASANSRVGPNSMKEPIDPEPDRRDVFKEVKGSGHRP